MNGLRKYKQRRKCIMLTKRFLQTLTLIATLCCSYSDNASASSFMPKNWSKICETLCDAQMHAGAGMCATFWGAVNEPMKERCNHFVGSLKLTCEDRCLKELKGAKELKKK